MTATSKRQPPLTRDAILDASTRLLQQYGFSALGMRQIAEKLNIKAPGLYHHFSSKEVLAQCALEKYRQDQAARLREIELRSAPIARLNAYAELFAAMLDDGKRPCLYLMMVRESSFEEPGCEEELKRFAQQNIDWLASALTNAGSKPQSCVQMPERDLAELIFATLEGLMALSLTEQSPAIAFRSKAAKSLRFLLGNHA